MVSRTMGVSRAQLSLRINRSADWQDRRCNRRNEEADAEILSAILNIISDMPSYGYRRVWGILRKQRRTEGQPPVNAKRLYRIMSEHNLLLLHHKPERPKREHKGKIAVAESGLAPIFPYTFYHLTHDWFVAADIPVANDTPVHYADAIRCNVRRPPQGSLPLLTRRVSA